MSIDSRRVAQNFTWLKQNHISCWYQEHNRLEKCIVEHEHWEVYILHSPRCHRFNTSSNSAADRKNDAKADIASPILL